MMKTIADYSGYDKTEREDGFDFAVSEALQCGFILACFHTLLIAMKDRRLQHSHRAVLAILVENMPPEVGSTFVGRERIAQELNLASKTVSNALRELQDLGYILADNRRTQQTNYKSLRHYTINRLSREALEAALNRFTREIKARPHQSPRPQGLPNSQTAGTFTRRGTAGQDFAAQSPAPSGTVYKEGQIERQLHDVDELFIRMYWGWGADTEPTLNDAKRAEAIEFLDLKMKTIAAHHDGLAGRALAEALSRMQQAAPNAQGHRAFTTYFSKVWPAAIEAVAATDAVASNPPRAPDQSSRDRRRKQGTGLLARRFAALGGGV